MKNWISSITILAFLKFHSGFINGELRMADTASVDTRSEIHNVLADYASPIDLSIIPPNITSKFNGTPCRVTLFTHEFANSYGKPYIGPYKPPAECLKSNQEISAAVLRFTGSVKGRQYDRFGAIYLDGYEILRTTTAEPTNKGITWTFEKDISDKAPLFYKERTVTASIGNLVNDIYTGVIKVQVEVLFYFKNKESKKNTHEIISISKGSGQEAWFTINNSTLFEYPISVLSDKVEEAELEVFLSPHGCDEFWYINAPHEYSVPRKQCINGAYREVQVLIDGQVVGSILPFPTVYTGGITLTLWRPISGLGSFDVPTSKLNLNAFIPLLTTKGEHKVGFKVIDATEFWLISANLHVFKSKLSNRKTYLAKPETTEEVSQKTIMPPNNPDDGKFGVKVDKKYSYTSIFTQKSRGSTHDLTLFSFTQSSSYIQDLDISNSGSVYNYVISRKVVTDVLQFEWKSIPVNHLKSGFDTKAIKSQLETKGLLPKIYKYSTLDEYELKGKLSQQEGSGPGGYNLSSEFSLSSNILNKKGISTKLKLEAIADAIRPSLTESATGDCKSSAEINVKVPNSKSGTKTCYSRKIEANHGFYTLDKVNDTC